MTIDQIKRANEQAGFFFFSPDTMRFFKSRVSENVYESSDGLCAFFVTSERGPNMARRYTVRRFSTITKNITTAMDFQHYPTSRQAHSAARFLSNL